MIGIRALPVVPVPSLRTPFHPVLSDSGAGKEIRWKWCKGPWLVLEPFGEGLLQRGRLRDRKAPQAGPCKLSWLPFRFLRTITYDLP